MTIPESRQSTRRAPWWFRRWQQLRCRHFFEPWYHAWHCYKCGKTIYD